MKKQFIVNGEITEEEKEKLKEAFKYLEKGQFDNLEIVYTNNKYDLQIKCDEKQIIANVKKIS